MSLFMHKRKAIAYILPLVAMISLFSCTASKRADMIVHHAQIYTVDSSFSVVQAMAISSGKIIETGTDEVILKKYQSDEIVDAGGQTIFPGFIDAHCHFTGYAADSWKCELTGTRSFEEVIGKVEDYAKNAPMNWIYGRGWDQNDWAENSFPDNTELNKLFPDRPVFLKRIDGHAALVNQKVIELAGINDRTTIEGGSFVKKNGKLTGLLIDNAMGMVEKIIPELSDSLVKKYFVKMQERCFALGLTGVHDCGISEHTVDLIDEEQKNGQLKMKIFALLSDSAHYYDRWLKKGPYQTDRLHVGGFKLYADGALGSRGACLLDDYTDQPHWRGFLLSESKHFDSIAQRLSASKFQMCTHAIGDSGNREILSVYARTLKGKNDKRWRIEHAQVVDFLDLKYFGDNSIVPSVQPTHATSDMYWASSRLGANRIKTAYAYQSLLQQNGWMPLGTDFPVEAISPFKTFFAAVVRKDSTGYPDKGFQTDQALSREQAIRGMTIWAAKAAFEENEKGSLEPGKAADFIILNNDLMRCKGEDILKTRVNVAYINGEKVFQGN